LILINDDEEDDDDDSHQQRQGESVVMALKTPGKYLLTLKAMADDGSEDVLQKESTYVYCKYVKRELRQLSQEDAEVSPREKIK
jgi:hypothetical protein